MTTRAVLFIGPPGAGKGTQADLLAKKMRWIHFDTGPYLKDILYDEEKLKDPVMKREREVWDAGQLNDPRWVLSITSTYATHLATCNQGIIFSGSPRTEFEAFGNAETPGLIETLTHGYGKENLRIFVLEIPKGMGGERNSERRLCSSCRLIILSTEETKNLTKCVHCAAPLERRITLDDPEKYALRLNEFTVRTEPILEGLVNRGFILNNINASQLPFEVHRDIAALL